LVWHVLQKEDNDWLKKYMVYEVEGARPRGRAKTFKLNRSDAIDRSRWRKQIKDD